MNKNKSVKLKAACFAYFLPIMLVVSHFKHRRSFWIKNITNSGKKKKKSTLGYTFVSGWLFYPANGEKMFQKDQWQVHCKRKSTKLLFNTWLQLFQIASGEPHLNWAKGFILKMGSSVGLKARNSKSLLLVTNPNLILHHYIFAFICDSFQLKVKIMFWYWSRQVWL